METKTNPEQSKEMTIGVKAKNLFRLKALGFRVPEWVVISAESFLELLPETFESMPNSAKNQLISAVSIPECYLKKVFSQFGGDALLAVRSSGEEEDGSSFSFAGQFESYLNVTKEKLEEKIKQVWLSAFSERVIQYRKNHHLTGNAAVSVIIQEMVDATVSGVAFSMNPGSGERDVKVINAVYGLGEGLVSGALNADSFFIKGDKITSSIVDKTRKVVPAGAKESGTKMILTERFQQQLPALSKEQVLEIAGVLEVCANEWGRPVDIEFAYSGGLLYVLQVRPVTNLHRVADPNGTYILWDNSNIIESYPGVTTPLTFSFIRTSYETAYRLFCAYMGVDAAVLKQNEPVFANTLGLMNGRVYYNLKSWYLMLAMLPGYRINARFMEKMMGVKERFDIPESYRLSVAKAWWRIVKMAVRMFLLFLSLPRKRKQFVLLVNETISGYKSMDLNKKDPFELMQLYRRFESELLNEWKAPLLNDFFAMIWFGRLEKKCKKYAATSMNIHNDLLCASNNIISTQPLYRCMALAEIICGNEDLKALFNNHSENTVWEKLKTDPELSAIKKEIDRYIGDFGDRCVAELKLETVSYTQDPAKFIRQLQGYVAAEIRPVKTPGRVEKELRKNAEQVISFSLQYKPVKKWMFKRILKKTRELVCARENLRYERTRAFGIVRELFCQIGNRFYSEGIIEKESDIFYLGKEEIFSFIEGTALTQDIKGLIALRKIEFDEYKIQKPPSERFATYGPVYHANDFFCLEKTEPDTVDLKGIGCSPGKVCGKVKVVLDPDEGAFMDGAILVTSSTDPGWTTLFPACAGIIVERGSLLSHSAIVSREMGKPCIVGVTGLLQRLHTGDEIAMDGSTGEIKVIQGNVLP